MSPSLTVVALAITVLVSAPSAFAGVLGLTFDEHSVTIGGATPGGSVALLAIAKEGSEGIVPIPLETRYAEMLRDDDRDGRVVFDRKRALPLIAIWVAVDVTSGQWAAGSGSSEFDALHLPLEEFAKKDNAGQLRKISARARRMDALVVRPGTGAWEIYAARTSKLDESEPAERTLRIDLRNMAALSGSPPPPNAFQRGDILAVIEPLSMRFAVVEVGK